MFDFVINIQNSNHRNGAETWILIPAAGRRKTYWRKHLPHRSKRDAYFMVQFSFTGHLDNCEIDQNGIDLHKFLPMPSIFEYLGILVFFYSNEHEPVHVHAKHAGCESKAEFYIVNGKVTEIRIKPVKGYNPLTGAKLKDFEQFLEVYSDRIVQKWIDYFVYHKDVPFEKINTRLK